MFECRLLGVMAVLFGLAGCAAPVAVPIQENPSAAWSAGIPVAEAAHLGAPAVGLTEDGWAIAWADGPDLFFRQIALDGTPGAEQALYLGTRTPWNPMLLPAPDGGWHLIWQDWDALDEARLYNARLAADGTLLRGPVTLTPEATGSFAAAPADNGTVVVVWASAGARPSLYGQFIDADGRPTGGPPALIAHNAAMPALARTSGGLWTLAWLSTAGDSSTAGGRAAVVRLSAATLPWEGEALPGALGPVESIGPTEYVETVRLGLDQSYGYLFVGHRDASTNIPRTDALVFPLSAASAIEAESLETIRLPDSSNGQIGSVDTGFNTGPALPLPDEVSGTPVGWPVPAWGQFAVLPVAFEVAGEVAAVYFQDGALIGWQPITAGANAAGALGLWTDRTRHLTLAWANLPAANDSSASLLLSTTRPEPAAR